MNKYLLFLLLLITTQINAQEQDAESKNREEAVATFAVLDKSNLWVNSFSNEDIQVLPVGVKHTFGGDGGNIQAALGISKAVIYSTYAELTVFARVRLPQTDASGKPLELFFGANNIKLSHQGGIIGDANLVLLGDLNIPFSANKWMLTLKGGFDYRSGNIQNLTYVKIDCDGIKEMGITGAVEFSRDMILPIEPDGEVNESKTTISVSQQTELGTYTREVPYRVKGEFQTVVSDWNDMLLEVSLQPFVLKDKRNGDNYDGNFQFYVNKAVLDLSDLRNSSTVRFPSYYADKGLLLPNANLWRGVYIETVEVQMPKEFMTTQTAETQKRVSFGSHNLLIDNYGVSGEFYADNLIPLKEGITNKEKAWAYSVDHIEVNLAAGTLVGADFKGKIVLPVSNADNERSTLSYEGFISPKEYLVNVKVDSAVDFNLWKATGRLEKNSYVELKVKEGQFRPKAVLNGYLGVFASLKNKDKEPLANNVGEVSEEEKKKALVLFEGIEFQSLTLQTEAPLFSVEYMGYKNEGGRKLGNFPVTLYDIGIRANEQSADLYFDVSINLMGNEANNGFSARTKLAVLGKFEDYDRKQKWNFKGVDLEAINLDADLGVIKLKGSLIIMEDNPTYGDGFSASLQGNFGGFGYIACNAIFGSADFRYWMVDGAVDKLKIGTGVVNISGFAGGASYQMLRKPGSKFTEFNPSGLNYIPNKDTGLGVKAMVRLNIGSDKAINGGAGFEIIFNKNGGVNQMGFYGNLQAMKKEDSMPNNLSGLTDKLREVVNSGGGLDSIAKSGVGRSFLDVAKGDYPKDLVGSSAISAFFGMQHDFVSNTFHAELEIYVNVVGGLVRGQGANNRAGLGVIHASPDEWYAYLGKPSDRIGLKVGIGSFSINAGGYFMVGDRLEASPPPPSRVAEILGVDLAKLDYRDANALSGGRGFAFGQDFSLDTGDLRFLIFYARFEAGGGFDIMLRDYGDTECINTNEQVGINGWYANGQAYAYLQGELGIRIKLFFINKKIPIIKAGAAALFQAKAPNPVWLRGYLGGSYSLLGGLIKGSFRFKITLGKECEFADEYPLGGIKIITDLSPDNDSESDVFAIPQAAFAFKVGEDIVIPEDNGDNIYKINLDKFRVIDETGKEMEGNVIWNQYKDRADFVSKEILPPNKKLTAEVEVSFTEKVNGIYRQVTVDGKQATEVETRSFTTGDAPNVIPLQNIQYSYPVLDQQYFFTDEYDKGYVQLKRGQSYLFDDTVWKSELSFTDKTDKKTTLSFDYSEADNRINYTLPNLNRSDTYQLVIASKLKDGQASSQQTEPVDTYTEEQILGEENTVQIKQSKAQTLSKDGEIERLTYGFSTSQYNTLKQKINSINIDGYNVGKHFSDVIYLVNTIKDHEDFDLVELTGNTYTENIPTISVEAVLEDDYFKKDINPPLYSQYPLGGKYKITNRDSEEYGVPPVRALPINTSYLSSKELNTNKDWTRTSFPYKYDLPLSYKEDWVDLQSQIANDYVKNPYLSENITQFLDENYKFIRQGTYKIRLKYRLPGGIDGSQATINYKNDIKLGL
jgi:hypothetical protein